MQPVSMDAEGRLIIPAPVRTEIGMAEGGAFAMSVQDGKLVLEPYHDVLGRVRADVRKHVPPRAELAEELIRDRREETGRD